MKVLPNSMSWDTMKPIPEVSASTAGAALGFVITWIVHELTILEPTTVVYAAVATVCAFLFGWVVHGNVE